MNIGIDIREFKRGCRTGIGRYLKTLIQVFSERKDCKLFLFGNQDTECPEVFNAEFKKINELNTFIWDQIQLPAVLKKNHCQWVLSPYFKAPFLTGVHLMLIVNDLIPMERWYFRWLLKKSVKKAQKIISISNTTLDELEGFYPGVKGKTEVVYLSIDPVFLDKSKTGSSLDGITSLPKKYVLNVGNANTHKNLNALMLSFKNIKDIDLVLCGLKEDEQDGMAKFIKTNNIPAGKVTFLPHLTDIELKWVYQHALCAVFPSEKEGFGLPPLEAMACGTPVLASNIPCHKEILSDAAHYMNNLKPEGIAGSILGLLEDSSLRSKLKEKGISRSHLFREEIFKNKISQLIDRNIFADE